MKKGYKKKRIARFARNTENNTENITKITQKKNDWGYRALQKIKAEVMQKQKTTLYKTKKINYEYDTRFASPPIGGGVPLVPPTRGVIRKPE